MVGFTLELSSVKSFDTEGLAISEKFWRDALNDGIRGGIYPR